MKMPPSRPCKTVPMIMQLTPSAILYVVNQQLIRENRPTLPVDASVSVTIPNAGAHYKGEQIELDEGSVFLDIRWEA